MKPRQKNPQSVRLREDCKKGKGLSGERISGQKKKKTDQMKTIPKHVSILWRNYSFHPFHKIEIGAHALLYAGPDTTISITKA